MVGGIDLNGDGRSELVIGAPGRDRSGAPNSGAVYVYAGRPRNEMHSGAIADLAMITFLGANSSDNFGAAVAAGDLNGDGQADLFLGAPAWSSSEVDHAGQVAVYYGGGTRQGTYDFYDADLVIYDDDSSAGRAHAGGVIADGCDVNGDGIQDLVIGAPGASSDGVSSRGRVYFVAGVPGGLSGVLPLSEASGSFWGEVADDEAGSTLACVGDVNGDGYEEVLVGASAREGGRGGAYLIYGSPSGWPVVGELGQGTVVFRGEAQGDRAGAGMAGGDLNGDGLAEVLIASPERTIEGQVGAGVVYVLAGARGE